MLNEHSPNLFDLVWLCQRTPWLQVKNVVNAFSREDVVAALDPLREAKTPEKNTEVVESNASIR
jgi:hypothetical protein